MNKVLTSVRYDLVRAQAIAIASGDRTADENFFRISEVLATAIQKIDRHAARDNTEQSEGNIVRIADRMAENFAEILQNDGGKNC